MATDMEIATLLDQADRLEASARHQWAALRDPSDLPDKDAALIVVRQAGAVRRAIESWIQKRSRRLLRQENVGAETVLSGR